jgi:hypothetical protein
VTLNPLPFATGSYDLILSLLVSDLLPFTPLAAAIPDPLHKVTPESWFYRPEVRAGFSRVYAHHHRELRRMLSPGGTVIYSEWRRQDTQPGLVRVGDSRISETDYRDVFAEWGQVEHVRETEVYPGEPPRMQHYFLDP